MSSHLLRVLNKAGAFFVPIFQEVSMPQAINTEEIISIPLSKLHSFPDHPFSVKDDASMDSMVDSIKAGGILTPILVILFPK